MECYIFRNVFSVEEKTHCGHMNKIKQSVLDGTSKWSAKIAITGLFPNLIGFGGLINGETR